MENLKWRVTLRRKLTTGHWPLTYLSITFGTRKNVPSASGAFSSADSWDNDFRNPSGTSSRLA
jgi:hypothetical protein